MNRLHVPLWEPVQAHRALAEAWMWIKPMLMAGNRLVFDVSEESKTREQEKKYHAMLADITRQAKHIGATWEAEDWKRLLIDKFARETGRTQGKIIPNLDGNGVVEVGVLSRKFSKSTANEFIEFLNAWGAQNGITFTGDLIDPETGEIRQ